MAINTEFSACFVEFKALQAIFESLNGDSTEQEAELAAIMNDANPSPFKDLIDSVSTLKDTGLEALGDIINVNTFKNPIDAIINAFLRPIGNITKILESAAFPKELRERISNFIEREGFSISFLDTSKMTALVFSSALQGIATINHQRKVLNNLDLQVRRVIDNMRDTPSVTPPVHPFQETLIHIRNAKNNFQGVRSQLLRINSIDKTRYSSGINDMDLAAKSIYNGNLGESISKTLINQAGLGNFIGVKNDNGQIEYINKEKLKAIDFLPPVELSLYMIAIKKLHRQLNSYNASISGIESLLKFLINNLYLLIDISRLLSSMIQFLILELTDIEKTLDGAATNSPIGNVVFGREIKSPTGTISAQVQSYGMIQLLIQLSKAIKSVMDKFNENNVNDVPKLKVFRKKLESMNPDKCINNYTNLDKNISAFESAYNRRLSQKLSSNSVRAIGQRVRNSIKEHLDFLDCFEENLNSLGLDNIPPGILNSMAWIGSALSILQGFDTSQIKELFYNFSPKAVIVAEMNSALSCMENSCKNPTVRSIVSGLHTTFQSLDKSFKTSSNLNISFSNMAKYNLKYNGNRLSDAIQQLINAVNNVSC